MTGNGWTISIRRIHAEFDVPQFVAEALVRKIAANNFRLPVADRINFAQLPDDVIARVEHIVRDACLEVSEEGGGEAACEGEDLRNLGEKLNSVPADFPRNPTPASLSGMQPKLTARLIGGKFVVGLTEAERFERWDMCEDLAQQLIPKVLKDAAKFPQHSHEVTLGRMRRAIEARGWTEGLESDWLIERLRVLLDW